MSKVRRHVFNLSYSIDSWKNNARVFQRIQPISYKIIFGFFQAKNLLRIEQAFKQK